jgi:hypothetical protein
MTVLEKDIEGNVVRWAAKRGFLTLKVKFADIGYPDRLFISPKGHTIFIEFKVPGKKPDPIQNFRLSQLRARGIPAYWADTFIEAVNILKAALEPETVSEASHKTLVESSVRRLIPRSGAGENIHRPRSTEDIERETADKSCPDCDPD